MLVLEGLVGLHKTIQLQLLQHYWLGHRLGLLWYWMVCLGNKQIILLFLSLHTITAFWTLLFTMRAIFSKRFLPTVVDIMIIWVKFHWVQEAPNILNSGCLLNSVKFNSDIMIIWVKFHWVQEAPRIQYIGNSPAVQWLWLGTFTAGARVCSLVGELRSLSCARDQNKPKDKPRKRSMW